MLILGLLGMYFDAAVVFVTNSSLLFRSAVAILWVCLFRTLEYIQGVPKQNYKSKTMMHEH